MDQKRIPHRVTMAINGYTLAKRCWRASCWDRYRNKSYTVASYFFFPRPQSYQIGWHINKNNNLVKSLNFVILYFLEIQPQTR